MATRKTTTTKPAATGIAAADAASKMLDRIHALEQENAKLTDIALNGAAENTNYREENTDLREKRNLLTSKMFALDAENEKLKKDLEVKNTLVRSLHEEKKRLLTALNMETSGKLFSIFGIRIRISR